MNKILLFSHDPGGANTIFPLVKPLKEKGYKPLLFGAGPALKKYEEYKLKGIDILSHIKDVNLPDMTDFMKQLMPNFVITGTSLKDSTERALWNAANTLKIPSFAIIDSWMNYKIRFLNPFPYQNQIDHEELILPTKICIMDEFSKIEAIKDGLDENKLLVTGQPYFQFLAEQKNNIINKKGILRKAIAVEPSTLLITFISEPISESYKTMPGSSEGYLGYTEKTIFTRLYSIIEKFAKKLGNTNVALTIKLHPRENANNYQELLNKLNKNPKIQIIVLQKQKISNWELILSSDLVCGMASMLLVESFLLDKPILSIQIGLKRESPFILDKMNIVKSITDEEQLYHAFEEAIADKRKPKYNFNVIDNPIENIISSVEKILWQN